MSEALDQKYLMIANHHSGYTCHPQQCSQSSLIAVVRDAQPLFRSRPLRLSIVVPQYVFMPLSCGARRVGGTVVR